MPSRPDGTTFDNRDKKYYRAYPENDGDEIVISGMSGRFPNSRNVAEYEYHLYNKVDMVRSSDGIFGCATGFDISERIGKVFDLNKFDSKFFGVHNEQTRVMDPQCRLLLEVAYEALLDSGINPKKFRGSKTGVFISASYSDTEKAIFYTSDKPDGNFGISGCSRAMFANRLSFSFGLNGPSYLVDSVGSVQALDVAYELMRSGSIDAALIGGANIILYPQLEAQFKNIGVISSDGYTRSFDKNSSGYNRSEAMNCILLQKKRNAKRVYGHIVHCKANNDGYNPEGIINFSTTIKEKLLKDFYNDININPKDLGYCEANGSGIPNEDIEECKILDNVFCKKRREPLLIGSVKSNMGYADAASGVSALIKICIALQNGKVPPNIHFNEPRSEITSLINGRLKVVTEVENLKTPYIAFNSFSLFGSNCHALLKSYEKEKINHGIPDDNMPRLVNWSGRTKHAVNTIFDFIINRPLDSELIGMMHQIQDDGIANVLFRGYGLFRKDTHGNAQCIGRNVQHYNGIKRPIVWVFSGMGSQWTGMGSALMNIPLINESIQRCHRALLPKKLNLIEILTSKDKTIYDNILNSFVGIAAIQIALVDFLKYIGIEPDYIIGHSVGELGCGYADNGFTAEQMILAAYSRGKVSVDVDKIKGSMAAIGMGYKSIIKILPKTIEVACHNSADSCTISGPAEDVNKFVAELKERNIFAKEVPCSNIAYHSQYISHLGPQLLKYMKEIIPNPKLRSKKWLCSSVPKLYWDHPNSKYCSAEYHTNNLLNSVLFEETAVLLPPDALTIEIAPHGLLQAILKRSMLKAIHIPLTQRDHINNDENLIQALGKIYMNGVEMHIDRIYPKIEYPVSRGTANLSSLIRWDHSEDWDTVAFETIILDKRSERTIEINLQLDYFAFLKDHMINGRVIVPASYILQFVIDSIAAINGIPLQELSIQFEDIKFLRYLYLTEKNTIPLKVMIQRGTGNFSVTENSFEIVNGYVKIIDEPVSIKKITAMKSSKLFNLRNDEFYKELAIRGHKYSGIYKGVQQVREDYKSGTINWTGNYTGFLESLFQIIYFKTDTKFALYPFKIHKLTILGKDHFSFLAKNNFSELQFNREFNTLISGGIELIDLETKFIPSSPVPSNLILQSKKFVSHFPSPLLSMSNAARFCLQLAVECLAKHKMKIVELSSDQNDPIIPHFMTALHELPLINAKCIFLSNNKNTMPGILTLNMELNQISNCSFIIAIGVLENCQLAVQAEKCLNEASYLISRENSKLNLSVIKPPRGFEIIAVLRTEFENLVLLQKKNTQMWQKPVAIKICESDVNWIRDVQNAIRKGPVVLYSENERCNGILGICHSLRSEQNENIITCVLIDDANAPCFSLDNSFYLNQLKLGLPVNILKEGNWGTYRQLNLIENLPLKLQNEHFYCDVAEPGDLSTLKWYQGNLQPSKCDVKVVYFALNFQDVLLATGRLQHNIYSDNRLEQQHILGIEFSGVEIKTGRSIMGISFNSGLASHINVNTRLMWEIPSEWSFQEAATIPVAYTLVYYAFFQIAPIKKAKSILIHSGAGGVGLAAIRVALAYGLNVFTTVSNLEKKSFLLETFPQLKEHQIGSSADTSFEEMIQQYTNNCGVDYILNSLSGNKLSATLRCIKRNGHFFQIGKYDLINNTEMRIGVFLREISFHAISVDKFYRLTVDAKVLYIREKIKQDIASGIIQPLKLKVFKAHEVQHAFKYLTSGNHVGKVLIEIRNDSNSNYSNPIKMEPCIYFNPKMVYIVSDSFNEFGLEFVDWMITRGSRKIILHSTENISQPYKLFKIGIWKNYGVDITLSSHDITTRQGCETLLLHASTQLGSVGGIFNLNNISWSDNMDSETLTIKMRLKVDATKHLDDISRQLCSKLDHFVVMSTLICPSDHRVQTLSWMTNSLVERIVENRVSESFPGKVVVWGDIRNYEYENDAKEKELSKTGIVTQEIKSCLEQLDKLFSSSEALVSCIIVDKKSIGQEKNIMNIIADIVGIKDLKSVSYNSSLVELGLNSLTALEVNHFLKQHYSLNFSLEELKVLSLENLYIVSCEYSQGTKKSDDLNATSLEEAKGISAMLNNFGKQRLLSKQIVHNLESNSIDKSSQLIFIPGIEGSAETSITDLALKLHSKFKILQLNESINALSIKDIAQSTFNTIRNVLKKGEKFYLVGYSFGALITLELAALLEKFKYSGNIVLIDGAPHFLNELVAQNLCKSFTDEDLYNEIFVALSKQIPSVTVTPDKLMNEYKILKTFESKIKKLMEYGKNHHVYTQDYAEIMIRTVFNRIRMIGGVDENDIELLVSPITLVRPKEVSIEDIDKDYKLSKLTKGKVIVKYVDGNHITILENSNLASIINSFDPAKDEKKIFENYLNSSCVVEKDFV